MTTVVDASLLVAALVDSGHEGRWAESTLAEGHLAAPELALVEASNVLRRLERSERISRIEATGAHGDLLRLEIQLFPFAPFAERIWALRSGLTSYDAWRGPLPVSVAPWPAPSGGAVRWQRGWIARL